MTGGPILRVKVPGRLCLLGEHQDYFGLSIIAAAFDRYHTITVYPHKHPEFVVELPRTQERYSLPLEGEMAYAHERDYLRAGRNVMWRHGARWQQGYRVLVQSTVPMGKGVSSSSALCVGWTATLGLLSEPQLEVTGKAAAEWGFEAEVAEFKEPGGRMDHYATSMGQLIHLDCGPTPPTLSTFTSKLDGLILADSRVVKDTTGVLSAVKGDVLLALAELQRHDAKANLRDIELDGLPESIRHSELRHHKRLRGTLMGRDLTKQGKALLDEDTFTTEALSPLINRHHEAIRDELGLSTQRIEMIRDAAMLAGASAGKIVGSGAGGCVVLLAPGREEAVIAAIERAGGAAMPVSVEEGLQWEQLG